MRKNLFGAVLYRTDAPKLRAKGLYYLATTSPDPQEMDLAKIDAMLDQAAPILHGDWSALDLGGMARLMGAAAGSGSPAQTRQMLAAMQTELPRVAQGLKAALDQPGSYKSPWPDMRLPESLAAQSAATRLISDDGRTGFILLRFLEEDTQSFAQNDKSIAALRQLTAEAK